MGMRDVTEVHTFQEDAEQALRFFYRPMPLVKNLPNWQTSRIIIFHLTIMLLIGVISGALSFSWFQLTLNLIFLPLISSASLFTMAGIIHLCLTARKTPLAKSTDLAKFTFSFRSVLTLVMLCQIPMYASRVLSILHPALISLGVAASAYLLFVGLVENFKLERKAAAYIVLTIYVLAVLLWMGSFIQTHPTEAAN